MKLRSLFHRSVANARRQNIAHALVDFLGVDLQQMLNREKGILQYQDAYCSGEHFLVHKVLPTFINLRSAVILDVGANIGNYAAQMREQFPHTRIVAFEPNPTAFAALKESCQSKEIECHNIALGSGAGFASMFVDSDNPTTEHGTLHRGVLGFHGTENRCAEFRIEIQTLDAFCDANKIGRIDFLKIDTEGHEKEVLLGGISRLRDGRLPLIQFEFNEMNLISRVFLRDFYEILSDYSLYRLKRDGLLPLGPYAAANEIFQFQNILAVHKTCGVLPNGVATAI